MNFERALLSVLRGEKKAPLLLAGLAPFGLAYRALAAARNFAYDRALFPAARLPVPVVSVGNISVGGTGKTPLVHLMALELQDKFKLAILSRGYRSPMEQQVAQVLPSHSAAECGDEPYFLAHRTKAAVWVGADRVESGRRAAQAGAQCLLLDDGMQHRRLRRDVEIVVVDGADPVSKGRFLPWGLLRDSPKRLQAADLIVVNHFRDEKIVHELRNFTDAPIVGAQFEAQAPIAGRKVGLFCGIGQPARFTQTVRDLKSEIVDTLFVRDHGSLTEEELERFARQCREKGAEALVCTEKDFVKLPQGETGIEIVPVAVRMKIAFGKEHWDHCIENILDKVVK